MPCIVYIFVLPPRSPSPPPIGSIRLV